MISRFFLCQITFAHLCTVRIVIFQAKTTSTPSPPTSGAAVSGQERHRDVSSFLKFSIQNILQHAAASGAGAAAAVAAAASRRSSDIIQADVAAAMNELDMKRAMTSLPFW